MIKLKELIEEFECQPKCFTCRLWFFLVGCCLVAALTLLSLSLLV